MSNAPRYRLVGYDIGTAPDDNGGWVHWTDHEAEVARLTAERDAAQSDAEAWARKCAAADEMLDAALAGAVKVKPLVWAAHSRGVLTARTAFGTGYSVADSQWNYGPTMVWFHAERGDEAAKAAAQADYDARILAAIQPDPDARQADLAKAWTMATAAMAERAKSELSAAWAADLIVQWAQSLLPPADLAAKIGGE